MPLPRISIPPKLPIITSLGTFVLIFFAVTVIVHQHYLDLVITNHRLTQSLDQSTQQSKSLELTLTELQSQDQIKINQDLQAQIKASHNTYLNALAVYENLIDARKLVNKPNLDTDFAAVLKDLQVLNYASAETKIAKLDNDITTALQAAQATKGIDLASLTVSQSPPNSGYQRQKVSVDGQEYVVDIIAADLASTRVLVDTASDSTCTNDCPVMPLASFAARNGAFAAINGTYFCPASYPSCAGKTNSFDLLVMNKNKVYFNSDNNVYSTNPAVIFQGSSVRFVQSAMEWGRDTGIDSMLSNYPLLVMNGQSQFSGDNDPKKSSIGSRPFVAAKGSLVYIGIVRGASVAQAAKVLQVMGMDHALNLDSGGSTALWVNGSYKAGPGRDIPNAIVFVKK